MFNHDKKLLYIIHLQQLTSVFHQLWKHTSLLYHILNW